MPSTTEQGIIAKAKERFRTSLANCYYLQRWQSNLWTATQLQRRIYLDALPPPPNNSDEYTREELEKLRPYVLVYKSGAVELELAAAPAGYTIRGQMTAMLEQHVPHDVAGDPGELDRRFENLVGRVIATFNDSEPGLVELSKISEQGYLHIHQISDDGPYRVQAQQVESLGDHQRYYIDVTWGTR